jgi:hypothetical protein
MVSDASQRPSRIAILGLVLRTLFGRVEVMVGSFFLLVGSFFSVMVDPWNMVRDLRLGSGTQVATGRLSSLEKTHFGVGKSPSSTPIFVHRYSFGVPDGRWFQGYSYSTGQSFYGPGFVDVEYLPGSPQVSRIAGARCSLYGPSGLTPLIAPAVGIIMISVGFFLGRRKVRAWKSGAAPMPPVRSGLMTWGPALIVAVALLGAPILSVIVTMSMSPADLERGECEPPPRPRETVLSLGEGVDLVFVPVPGGQFPRGAWGATRTKGRSSRSPSAGPFTSESTKSP